MGCRDLYGVDGYGEERGRVRGWIRGEWVSYCCRRTTFRGLRGGALHREMFRGVEHFLVKQLPMLIAFCFRLSRLESIGT